MKKNETKESTEKKLAMKRETILVLGAQTGVKAGNQPTQCYPLSCATHDCLR
jgi:hypothetical protein